MLFLARKCFTTEDPKVNPAPLLSGKKQCKQTDGLIQHLDLSLLTWEKWQIPLCLDLDLTKQDLPLALHEGFLSTQRRSLRICKKREKRHQKPHTSKSINDLYLINEMN
jgi:predicted solute-binding protein